MNPPTPTPDSPQPAPPRMLWWGLLSVGLVLFAMHLQDAYPGSVLAVTAYKAHLLALGGWGGYWLDRALFPYDRPHQYLEVEPIPPLEDVRGFPVDPDVQVGLQTDRMEVTSATFGHAMLRRAIVVAACLVCVGLGA
jgi:hypothetical protein